MKSGWEYVDENGVREKLAPKTLAENVLITENGPALLDAMKYEKSVLFRIVIITLVLCTGIAFSEGRMNSIILFFASPSCRFLQNKNVGFCTYKM